MDNTQESVGIFKSPEVRVVEASAGAGKTYALAKRYVQLLLSYPISHQSTPIKSILAITFTNKAAFEMKARILYFLKMIIFEKFESDQFNDFIDPLNISKEEAVKRAFFVMTQIINHYNFFQVQTIDKFINAIISGCSFKLGITSNFRIKTGAKDYLQYCLDETIDAANGDGRLKAIFESFIESYLYIENRSGWFPKDDILSIITSLFDVYNNYSSDFEKSKYTPEDIIKLKANILSDIKILHEDIPGGVDKRFKNSLDKFVVKKQKSFDIDSLSNYFYREELPLRKGEKADKRIHELWDEIFNNLVKLSEIESRTLFNNYIDIFTIVFHQLQLITAKEDFVFLQELNKKAASLFEDGYINIEELYFRLATRFRHYLVDEFQDTSRLQWFNISNMVEEALSSGGTLFYVGDKKQAIYGFRGGEVALFDSVAKEYQNYNVVKDYLNKNYRSSKNIVEFNNMIFSPLNLSNFICTKEEFELEKKKKLSVIYSQDDLKTLYSIFESSTQKYLESNQGGYSRFEYLDEENKEKRDEILRSRLIDLINDLRNRFSLGDIAILTRSNAQIESITNWLLEEGFKVESERTLNIKENNLIQEIIAFLKFLNSPIDNISFAKFILGDIFCAVSGIASDEIHRFVFLQRENLAKDSSFNLYTAFRQEFRDIWAELLEEFFRNVGMYFTYELLISIYSKFNCLDNFSDHHGFFMKFLELVKRQEEEYPDLRAFLDYFDKLISDELYVNSFNANAIKLLTIHKSKGLEFPVVIIPSVEIDIQPSTKSQDNKMSYVLKADVYSINLIKLKETYCHFSSEVYQIYKEQYLKDMLNELNSVYVAFTRAKHELYGFIPTKVGASHNLAKFLIPENVFEFGEKSEVMLKKEKEVNVNILKPTKYIDWISYLKDEFSSVDEMLNKDKVLIGKVIHFVLSDIWNLIDNELDNVINNAIAKAKIVFTEVINWDYIRNTILYALSNELFKDLFYAVNAEVFNEFEIVDSKGNTKRIDRLIIKKEAGIVKEIVVVDYKSSSINHDQNLLQVSDYRKLVQEVFEIKEVQGFILYLDEMKKVAI